jgi:hypothetical protein
VKRNLIALVGGVALILGIAAPVQAAPAVPIAKAPAGAPDYTPAKLPTIAGKPAVATKDAPKRLKAPKGMPSADRAATRGLTACSTICYDYATTGQTTTVDPSTGATFNATISKPFVALTANNSQGQDDWHSVIEIAAVSDGTNGINAAEIGWHVAPSVNGGSTEPHLFVYHWEDGAATCYNTCGFTDLSGGGGYSPVGPGDSLVSYKNQTLQFGVRYFTDAQSSNRGGWWTSFNGLYVGYFDESNWVGLSPSQTFVDTDRVQMYGEVAAKNEGSCTDMGSGAMAGTSPSTVFNTYSLFDSTETEDFNGLGWSPTESTRWGSTFVGTPATTARVGGPGANSIGEDVGVAGACAPTTAGTPPASTMQTWKEVCPDLGSTGCNAGAAWTAAGTTLNQCYPVPAGFTAQVLRNNSGVSGRNYQFYRSALADCTGATVGATNGSTVVLADDWDDAVITAVKRTG